VTRGRLPQRAGLPGLNGGGAAAAIPLPTTLATQYKSHSQETHSTINSVSMFVRWLPTKCL